MGVCVRDIDVYACIVYMSLCALEDTQRRVFEFFEQHDAFNTLEYSMLCILQRA